MYRKWLELILLTGVFGFLYFIPIQSAKLPVFAGQFNDLDGSLYVVRAFDLILSVGLILISSRYLIPKRLKLKPLFGRSLIFLGVFLTASLLEWGWDELTLRMFNLPIAAGEISDKMLMSPNRLNLSLTIYSGNLLLMVGGIFYGIALDYGYQIRQKEKLEHENLEAEVKYLRSQINPHFLFNTLNNIYAITQRNEDTEGSDALLRLSGLMRYMLYESSGIKIDLLQEIEHLNDYMDHMLLKYKSSDPPSVEFQRKLGPGKCQVAPLLLLPLVENSFKHGIDNQGKGYINIELSTSDSELNFTVINSRFPDREASPDHKGIGLENVKKRFEHLYPEKHMLNIESSENEYQIILRITL